MLCSHAVDTVKSEYRPEHLLHWLRASIGAILQIVFCCQVGVANSVELCPDTSAFFYPQHIEMPTDMDPCKPRLKDG